VADGSLSTGAMARAESTTSSRPRMSWRSRCRRARAGGGRESRLDGIDTRRALGRQSRTRLETRAPLRPGGLGRAQTFAAAKPCSVDTAACLTRGQAMRASNGGPGPVAERKRIANGDERIRSAIARRKCDQHVEPRPGVGWGRPRLCARHYLRSSSYGAARDR